MAIVKQPASGLMKIWRHGCAKITQIAQTTQPATAIENASWDMVAMAVAEHSGDSVKSKVALHFSRKLWALILENSDNTVIHQTWGEFSRVDSQVEAVRADVADQMEHEVDNW